MKGTHRWSGVDDVFEYCGDISSIRIQSLVNFIDGDGVAAAPEKSREVVRQEKCGFVDFAAGAAEWNSEIDFSLVKYPAWKTSLLELLS